MLQREGFGFAVDAVADDDGLALTAALALRSACRRTSGLKASSRGTSERTRSRESVSFLRIDRHPVISLARHACAHGPRSSGLQHEVDVNRVVGEDH